MPFRQHDAEHHLCVCHIPYTGEVTTVKMREGFSCVRVSFKLRTNVLESSYLATYCPLANCLIVLYATQEFYQIHRQETRQIV